MPSLKVSLGIFYLESTGEFAIAAVLLVVLVLVFSPAARQLFHRMISLEPGMRKRLKGKKDLTK